MANKLYIIICVLCTILGFIIGTSINKTEIKTVTETKFVRDTIKEEIPIPIPTPFEVVKTEFVEIEKEVVKYENDTTLKVPIPIEQKIYKTDKYKATIEGYNPRLLDMEIYENKEIQYVTTHETKYKNPKLQLGIGAGVSYLPNLPQGTNKIQPSINVAIYIPIKTIF